MNDQGERTIIAVIPAHNESGLIRTSIDGLLGQTRIPDRIIVVADNCTDDTAEIAKSTASSRVSVVETVGNTAKKAGALNQALSSLLPELGGEEFILVQDADSILNADFVENAARHLSSDQLIGAVGGTFRAIDPRQGARPNERFLRHLQDNEFARYARDVRRLRGKCLVVTGTAAMLRVQTLKAVSAGRLSGTLPAGDGHGGIYDTTVLTEDNELSFAVMTLGYRLFAPPDCLLVTDAVPTWRALWKQRLRWKRGAVENCVQYGFTRVTLGYWGRQALSVAGVIITAAYLGSIVWSLAVFGGIHVAAFWIGVTCVFVVERFVTLKDKGFRFRLLAATMYELPYEFFLQATHAKAYFDSITGQKRVW